MKTICVDFDGVIHKYSRSWFDGNIYDPPNEGAFEAIKKLRNNYNVIIYTSRKPEQIREWFKKHDEKCPEIFEKPKAIAYIDDRAIRFTNWKDILKYFK